MIIGDVRKMREGERERTSSPESEWDAVMCLLPL